MCQLLCSGASCRTIATGPEYSSKTCGHVQGMIELHKMQESQQKEAAAATRNAAGEDSDEDSDAIMDKQRAWDDWKDENPRGWGNSKLRPTA